MTVCRAFCPARRAPRKPLGPGPALPDSGGGGAAPLVTSALHLRTRLLSFDYSVPRSWTLSPTWTTSSTLRHWTRSRCPVQCPYRNTTASAPRAEAPWQEEGRQFHHTPKGRRQGSKGKQATGPTTAASSGPRQDLGAAPIKADLTSQCCVRPVAAGLLHLLLYSGGGTQVATVGLGWVHHKGRSKGLSWMWVKSSHQTLSADGTLERWELPDSYTARISLLCLTGKVRAAQR